MRLLVENGGSVLDPGKVTTLTQPFQRLGGDRTGSAAGTGLGLAIADAIAATHGGALHLYARPKGVCVRSSTCPPPTAPGRQLELAAAGETR